MYELSLNLKLYWVVIPHLSSLAMLALTMLTPSFPSSPFVPSIELMLTFCLTPLTTRYPSSSTVTVIVSPVLVTTWPKEFSGVLFEFFDLL